MDEQSPFIYATAFAIFGLVGVAIAQTKGASLSQGFCGASHLARLAGSSRRSSCNR